MTIWFTQPPLIKYQVSFILWTAYGLFKWGEMGCGPEATPDKALRISSYPGSGPGGGWLKIPFADKPDSATGGPAEVRKGSGIKE